MSSEQEPVITHRPQPGPFYWDFKCLRCDQPVSEHPSWWQRVLSRITNSDRGQS